MSLVTNKAVQKLRSAGRRLGINRLVAMALRGRDYEERFSRLLLDSVREGDCVWDVGANVGYYATRFADKVGVLGKVVCFEPSPENLKRLEIATDGISNLAVQPVALGASRGQMKLLQGLDEIGATSRIVSPDVTAEQNTSEVTIEVGDLLVEKGDVPTPNVIKVDTEGFELDVLRGLETTLKKKVVRAVFVEVHFKLLEERGQADAPGVIESMLRGAGFRCAWPDASHIAATRTT